MIPFNRDFRDLLSSFVGAEVRFLVVGAYALAYHGHVRATKDLDVWVDAGPANAGRVLVALEAFGAPVSDLSAKDLSNPDTVFQIGVEPRRIDIVCGVDGLKFDAAWEHRESLEIDGLSIPVLGRRDLLVNKKAVGRLQDLADVEALEKLES